MATTTKFSFASILFTTSFLGLTCINLHADVITENIASDIQEPVGTYDEGAPSLINMQVKTVISTGLCDNETVTGCTLNDVLNDINSSDDFKPELRVHFTADDFADDGLETNGTLRQRGDVSRFAPQKSFRIKLDKEAGLWRGQRRIQMVKSYYEASRVRNKLSFDMFKDIAHLPSMRTQFVNLSIEDQGSVVDQGLYTHIEHVGKEYLARRGWDVDSPVYKAQGFFYQNSTDLALDDTGQPVDLQAFENILEIKRGENHNSLIKMVQDLNNNDLSFQTQVFKKYFNQDNYLTWLAINILVNNTDTDAHNYYLYNPKDTERFYIIPWDYDFAWGSILEGPNETIDQLPRWWYSHANWWGNILHTKFLKEPGNLDLLKEAVEEIKNQYFDVSQINAKKNDYYDLVFPLITSSPDIDFSQLSGNTNPEQVAEYNRIFDDLSFNAEFNHDRFLERANDPMPFLLFDPQFRENNTILFSWEESTSLNNQTIAYDLEIATTKEFKTGTIIENITNLPDLSHVLVWTHPQGTYYYRVKARDTANPEQHWQDAINTSVTFDNGVPIYGVIPFIVNQNEDPTAPPITPPSYSDITSNLVTNGTITVDGNSADWGNLILFSSDADDVNTDENNIINWSQNALAHSEDTIYILYNNQVKVELGVTNGNQLLWGWQTYLDTDNNPNTGYQINNMGADHLLEGNNVSSYQGNGSSWDWLKIGDATSAFNNNTIEMNFPKVWLGDTADVIKLAFIGNNEAFNGNTIDYYPEHDEAFSYSLAVNTPPVPPVNPPPPNNGDGSDGENPIDGDPQVVPSRSGGGNLPWGILLLTSALLLIKRKAMK